VSVITLGNGVATYNGIILKDFKIEGNKANQNAGYGINTTAHVTAVKIEGVWVYQAYGYGIYISSYASYSVISHNKVEESGASAIYLYQAGHSLVSENQVINSAISVGYGIGASDADFVQVIGNLVKGDGTVNSCIGVFNKDGTDMLIANNTLSGCYYGISADYQFGAPDRFTIIGNQIYDPYSDGIYNLPSNSLVMGNFIQNCGRDGIASGNQVVRIIGNQIWTCAERGIDLAGDFAIVKDNVIGACQYDAIRLVAVENVVVADNIVYSAGLGTNNTYTDILLAGYNWNACNYNTIMGNVLLGLGAGNRKKYSIREDDAYCDYNEISHNRCKGAQTSEISLQGAASRASENTIT
jgi:hypothetical protein